MMKTIELLERAWKWHKQEKNDVAWHDVHAALIQSRTDDAAELAQLQAIATAAREVIDGQPLGDTAPDGFIANFRIQLGAIRQLAAALAALEQETK